MKLRLTRNENRCRGFQPAPPARCQWSVGTSCGSDARRPPSAAHKQNTQRTEAQEISEMQKKKKELKMTVFLYGLWCRRAAEVWVSFLFLVYFSS